MREARRGENRGKAQENVPGFLFSPISVALPPHDHTKNLLSYYARFSVQSLLFPVTTYHPNITETVPLEVCFSKVLPHPRFKYYHLFYIHHSQRQIHKYTTHTQAKFWLSLSWPFHLASKPTCKNRPPSADQALPTPKLTPLPWACYKRTPAGTCPGFRSWAVGDRETGGGDKDTHWHYYQPGC